MFIADVRGKKGSKNKQSSSSSSSSNGRGSMHSDSLRLTDDDRVTAFVVFASLLSKSRRLKEANKALAEAKVSLYQHYFHDYFDLFHLVLSLSLNNCVLIFLPHPTLSDL